MPPYTLYQDGNLDLSTSGGFMGIPFAPAPVKSDSGFFQKQLNKHEPITGKLFSRVPSKQDINQQNIANCWFLAALAAIAEAEDGPLIIQGMLCENARKKVTVRVYMGTDLPTYLEMDKSVVWVAARDKVWHSTGAAWVMMLEKAMTAFDKDGTFSPHDASYGRSEFNFGYYAFRSLLGIDAEYLEFGDALDDEYDNGSVSNQVLNVFHRLINGQLQANLPKDAAAIEEIFKSANSTLGASSHPNWCEWLNCDGAAVRIAWMELVSAKKGRTAQVVKSSSFFKTVTEEVPAPSVLRYEDFVKFMNEHSQKHSIKLPLVIKSAVTDWVRHQAVFAGKRGTGLYSSEQKRIYQFLLTQAQAKHPMTLDTRTHVGRSTSKGHSAAEPVSKGLAGSHSYAVLDVTQDKAGRCYVKIFNPWGTVGRQYSFLMDEDPHAFTGNTLADTYINEVPLPRFPQKKENQGWSAQNIESGTFWIELSDVTKRFHGISYCKSKPVVR